MNIKIENKSATATYMMQTRKDIEATTTITLEEAKEQQGFRIIGRRMKSSN